MESKYGFSFEAFHERIVNDDAFPEQLGREHLTREADFNRWETYVEKRSLSPTEI